MPSVMMRQIVAQNNEPKPTIFDPKHTDLTYKTLAGSKRTFNESKLVTPALSRAELSNG